MARDPSQRTTETVMLLTQRKGGRRPERRIEPRTTYDDKVVVFHRDVAGTATRSSAWGLNLSRGGIRVMLPELLAEGAEVGVGLRGAVSVLPGRVVWVAHRADGCVAGIAFAN